MLLNFILPLSLMIVSSAFFIVNPVIISLTVIIFTATISTSLLLFSEPWLAYALLLMFLGGMMVIFIYISSLVSSEKLITNLNPFLLIITSFILMLPFDKTLISQSSLSSSCLKIVFDPFGCENLILLTGILLLTLLLVVKMVQVFKGPLKWKL